MGFRHQEQPRPVRSAKRPCPRNSAASACQEDRATTTPSRKKAAHPEEFDGSVVKGNLPNTENSSKKLQNDIVVASARVAEPADARDLKSLSPRGECGFDSHPGHLITNGLHRHSQFITGKLRSRGVAAGHFNLGLILGH